MSHNSTFKSIPPSSIKPDPQGSGLLEATQMAIYDEIILAAMKGYSPEFSAAFRKLDALPLEKRYLWHVVSGLGFAFGDFDSACIRLDLGSLPSAQVDAMRDTMESRAIQFCILMREFFGEDRMKHMMTQAIERAAEKDAETPSDSSRAA
jgi:hypothetical protein